MPLKETIRGFRMIVAGECDHLPEQACCRVGTIDEAKFVALPGESGELGVQLRRKQARP